MEDNEAYKWVVVYEGSGPFTGGVFTDSRQVGEYVGTSESTIRRRGKEKSYFWINDYKIMRLPYHKSKRGG